MTPSNMHFHPLSILSIFTIWPLSGLATPLASRWDDMQAKHTWKTVPGNWESVGHPPADTTIDLQIALKAKHESALTDALYEVSSPGHPKYGAHLSREQVAEIVAPSQDALQLVNAWLAHHGVPPSTVLTKHGGSWLTLIGVPVSRANDLLSASYKLYQHTVTNDTVLRTLSYGLPAVLHAHVKIVAPTTHFGFPRNPSREHQGGAPGAQAKAPAGELGTALASRDRFVTPSFLRWLYKTSGYVPAAAKSNVLAVAGYNDELPNPDDLRLFMNEYRTKGTDATLTLLQVGGGGSDLSNPGPEASLNVQYTEAMAYPTPHIFYSIGNMGPFGDPFLNWLDYVLSYRNVPQTINTSYGRYGAQEYEVAEDYAKHVCELLAQLGLRGASVLFASGDDGVGLGKCLVTDTSGNSYVQFAPTFPSTCPYVTSVGGTRGDPEVAASLSGGGFSEHFRRPPYQDNAVLPFLKNLDKKHDGRYDPRGRGIPDIALQAIGFNFALRKKSRFMDGTSCSAPVAAGIISLLNDYLISKGRSPLGFLNPWLYGHGLAGLNDITLGSNPGCDTEGFSAIEGWDPVTGLGSLNFDKLEEILDDMLDKMPIVPRNATN